MAAGDVARLSGVSAPGSRLLRIDQLLSRFGHCSRREAAAWVRAGRVRVAGVAAGDASERVDPARTEVDGAPVEAPGGLLVMLHKPLGVVCSHDAREGPSIYDLVPPIWLRRNPPVTSVGRLDKDSSGLLLLTDVGEWVHRWTSPKQHVEKTYEVTVQGRLEEALVGVFASGSLVLPGEEGPCRPARLESLSPHEARVHLTEGRFHQVRRMFVAVGLEVVRLHRPRFGPYLLGDLEAGAWRRLEAPCFG